MARVLLIEDDLLSARYVESVLNRSGHSVVVSHNAIDAFNVVKSNHFDLIISDANLPNGKSGFDLVRSIRKIPGLMGLPIVFLTARKESEDVRRALVCGADDYMVKPADADIIVSKVTTLLGKSADSDESLFAKRKLDIDGTLILDARIAELSEAGVTLITHFPLPPKSKLAVQCRLFDSIGIKTHLLRVLTCLPRGTPSPDYAIEADFVGLSAADAKAIRSWLICHPRSPAAR